MAPKSTEDDVSKSTERGEDKKKVEEVPKTAKKKEEEAVPKTAEPKKAKFKAKPESLRRPSAPLVPGGSASSDKPLRAIGENPEEWLVVGRSGKPVKEKSNPSTFSPEATGKGKGQSNPGSTGKGQGTNKGRRDSTPKGKGRRHTTPNGKGKRDRSPPRRNENHDCI